MKRLIYLLPLLLALLLTSFSYADDMSDLNKYTLLVCVDMTPRLII